MVPPYALVNYGGATGLFARAYLARLTSTEVSSETAAATASMLVQEDAKYRARSAHEAARAQPPAAAAGGNYRHAETQAARPLLQPPSTLPGFGTVTAHRL